MLALAMLFWIGYTLTAPAWYWWCWAGSALMCIIRFGIDMFKRGSEL